MLSEKYGRTFHYPFSPGTTSDDRINHTYWEDIQQIETLIHTEKLDGENNCLSRYGVFARSHAAPTTSPWTRELRERWELMKNDLGDIEIFGENLYAIHSIEYRKLETHFYVFAEFSAVLGSIELCMAYRFSPNISMSPKSFFMSSQRSRSSLVHGEVVGAACERANTP